MMPKLYSGLKEFLRLSTKNNAVLMTVISVGNTFQQGVN